MTKSELLKFFDASSMAILAIVLLFPLSLSAGIQPMPMPTAQPLMGIEQVACFNARLVECGGYAAEDVDCLRRISAECAPVFVPTDASPEQGACIQRFACPKSSNPEDYTDEEWSLRRECILRARRECGMDLPQPRR